MANPPEVLPRHVLEKRLRRSRLLNVALSALALIGLVFGGVQLAAAPQTEGAERATHTEGAAGAAVKAPDVTPDEVAGAPAEAQAEGNAQQAQFERRIEGDPMALGAIDAPVVLNEWVDFRCPFCAVFSRDTFPVVVEEYVETGKVRIEMNDVAFFGDESVRAAVAARAAGEQGKYFEFVQALYAAAPESGHPELPPAELLEFARQVGVPDLAKFEADLEREDLTAAVLQSTLSAQQLGVTGVPFFAVNEHAFSGAQPIDTLRQFLDQQLAAN